MKAKALCVVLLSALLIWGLPTGNSGFNNSETKVAHTAKAEQRRVTTQGADVTVAVAETPQSQEPESQPEISPHEALMQQAGIPSYEWSAVDYIFSMESSWRPTAVNYLGCIGLGQSCSSGLASDCPDWRTDEVCQLRHFNSYAIRRYGSWLNAQVFWARHHWW